LRILLIIKSFSFGGAENHVRDLANFLSNGGHEVHVMAKRGYQNDRLNSDVHFVNIKMTDILLPVYVLFLCWFLRRHRIDVIHAHKRFPIMLACISGWVMKVPVVVTVHGKPWHDIRSPLARKMAGRIIFVSLRTVSQYRHNDEIKHKSEFIQNGVDPDCEPSDRDTFSLCYISRIDRKHYDVLSLIMKNVLPDIVNAFPMVKLHILGDGEYLKELRKEAYLINRNRKREVCVIHGYVPEVKPLIRNSGLVLGVGRVAIEALSCAVPVISLNREFMGQFVSEKNYPFYKDNNFVAAGHLPPDSDTLTSLIRGYLGDPVIYQDEALLLQRRIREDFGMSKIGNAIICVYEGIMASRSRINSKT